MIYRIVMSEEYGIVMSEEYGIVMSEEKTTIECTNATHRFNPDVLMEITRRDPNISITKELNQFKRFLAF